MESDDGRAEDATSTEVPELEALLNVLKALKPDAIAQHVLHSYFASPAAEADMLEQSRLTAALGDEPVRKIDPEALEGRAWNRVLSGKGMREARTDAVRGIRVRLGLPVAPRPRPTTSKPRIEPTPPPEDEMIVDVESDAPNDGYDTDGEPIVAGPSKRPRSPSLDQVDAPPAKRRESAFLPSLSVGYTLGDSDAEEWSGAEDERRREEKASTRKNRRGQRARQACVRDTDAELIAQDLGEEVRLGREARGQAARSRLCRTSDRSPTQQASASVRPSTDRLRRGSAGQADTTRTRKGARGA